MGRGRGPHRAGPFSLHGEHQLSRCGWLEKKVEKKPRGRPKKPSQPIAANIDTESNDEVIKSDEVDGLGDKVEPNLEVSEKSEASSKKRGYRKRSRRKIEDNSSNVALSLEEKTDLDTGNKDL